MRLLLTLALCYFASAQHAEPEPEVHSISKSEPEPLPEVPPVAHGEDQGKPCVDSCLLTLYDHFQKLSVKGSFDLLMNVDKICPEHEKIIECANSCPDFENKGAYIQQHDMALYLCSNDVEDVTSRHACWTMASQYKDENQLDVLTSCRQSCLARTNRTMMEWMHSMNSVSEGDLKSQCAVEKCIRNCAAGKLNMLCRVEQGTADQRDNVADQRAIELFTAYYNNQLQQQYAVKLESVDALIPECQWQLIAPPGVTFPEVDSVAEPLPETESKSEPEPKPEGKAEPEPESESEAEPKPESEPKKEEKLQPEKRNQGQAEPETEPEHKKVSPVVQGEPYPENSVKKSANMAMNCYAFITVGLSVILALAVM